MTDANVGMAGVPAAIRAVDASSFDQASLASLLATVREAQRCLDGLVIRIGQRAEQLAERGAGAPARDTLRGGGAVGSSQARREAGRVEAAGAIVGLGDAIVSGAVSAEHVDSIARHRAKLSDDQAPAFDFEPLIERAAGLPPEAFDRLLRRHVDAVLADHGLADAVAKQASSEFRHWWDERAGMGRFAGSLDPERYEQLVGTIDQHVTMLAASDEWAEHQGPKPRRPSPRPTRDVECRRPQPGAVHHRRRRSRHDRARWPRPLDPSDRDRSRPPSPSIARLCCDATIRRVTLDAVGVPLNVGRRYRTATDAQWTALKVLHHTCAWHGCALPITWCQAHHIRPWDRDGPTDLDNLVPLCSRHHHQVHEGRWQLKLLPDRRLEIQRPDGTHHATVDPPRRC